MKKKLFYAFCGFLLMSFSAKVTQGQTPNPPQLKALSSQQPEILKSSSNVSNDLKVLYQKHLAERNKAQAKPIVPVTSGLQKFIQVRGNDVLLDITVRGDNAKARVELEKIGFKVKAVFGRVISGSLAIEALLQLETLPNVKFARPAYKPMHRSSSTGAVKWRAEGDSSIKPVISQGDTALRSYIARQKYKVNGKGVKVGILSDSYNNLGTADSGVRKGELPGPDNPFGFETPVEVLEDLDFGGIDEGRAMAEIVHDVAPGAKIGFHTAFNGQADFAQGIIDLADKGYKVINDDVFYFAEPFFQDGIIAQAVDQVKEKGVTYFSAAGNQGRQSYESDFRGDSLPFGALFSNVHNFSAPGNPPVYFQPFKIPTFGETLFILQWDDPFLSAGGAGANSDVDIYLLDSLGKIVAAGNEDNITSGDPIDGIYYFNNTASTSFYILITKVNGPDPSHLKYIFYGAGGFPYTTPPIPGINAPTLVGHAKATGAIATAAAFWLRTPAYGSDTPRVEPFSSLGGVANLFDKEGNRISPVKRKKPEITSVDGGNTSFFPPAIYFGNQDIRADADTFPNFFGTSAAAPHAAGVAALMIEAQKLNTITPDQIKGILADNAIDMNDRYTTGFDKGFDFNTGYGFIQADKAVAAVKYPNVYVEDLRLEAICSYDPATTRNWKIINPNPFAVEAHWLLVGFPQADNIVVPPGEKTFSTNTASYMGLPVPNVVIIDWKDNLGATHVDVAYSTTARCGQEIVSEKNSDRRLAGVADEKTTAKPNTVAVYPNPATRNFKVYLALNKPQNIEMSLYSIDGKVLYQKTGLSNGVVDIDASAYKPGLYVLRVRQGEFTKTLKLVKQ